ncbi:MAG: sigma-70 region 4 domain-containing protein [Candidatus Sphingomonas phytovorans]|nr:sigma-70 region 4 domain-containing protein [Sphingomonas sp.]WEJ99472.1 MAG: sigma-70 region 4 domain-containing protein [Sphingomonas sp.]
MTIEPDPATLARLEAALRSMPVIEREIFLAARLDSLSYAEIARRTGRTARDVERRFAAALGHILRSMDRGGGP